MNSPENSDLLIQNAAAAARHIVGKNISEKGLAAALEFYPQVWTRDSVITFLGAALSKEELHLKGFRASLEILGSRQDKFGQIPYLVNLADDRAKFRSADSNPWFVIGAFHYARLSGESPFFDSKIAYIAETGPKGNRRKQLAIMDSDGANHRFITNGQSTALTPRYSPDYSKIAYLSFLNGTPRIYVYDIGTGQQRLVTEGKGPTFAPRWSPDGKYILYSMAIAGNTDIYRVPATGGDSVKLTDSPGIDVGGSYSPDGQRIVFESDRSGSQQVYVMNADGTNQKRISFFGGRAATPEWSPRGDQIAFTHIAGNLRIAVMNPSGGDMRYLTDSWQDEAPTWSPNGRIVQFFRTAKTTGKTSIWQVDLTGRNERRLNTPVDASDPAWGPVLP